MDSSGMLALMKRFRKAYAAGDEDELRLVTTADFEWHQHNGTATSDQPTGRVLVGIPALIKEIQWRQNHWRDVRYEGLMERATEDVLVQTFIISGKEDGVAFHAKAVDLYPVRDGLIERKDTYWKYQL